MPYSNKSVKSSIRIRIIAIAVSIIVLLSAVLTSMYLLNDENRNYTELADVTKIHKLELHIKNEAVTYKIKESTLLTDNDNSLKFGLISIEKNTIVNFSKENFTALFDFISEADKFHFITVDLKDGTGLLFTEGNSSLCLYGRITDEMLLSEIYSTIIKDSDSYLIIENKNDDTTEAVENISENSDSSEHVTQNNISPDDKSETVYVTASGKKYHKNGCSYLTSTQRSVSLTEAQSKGYTPCSRCFK